MNVHELGFGAAETGRTHRSARSPVRRVVVDYALRLALAAALGIDAIVHGSSASNYDPPNGGLITQGNLFRAEAAAAIIVALLVLVRSRRWTWIAALGVGASALGAVTLYRYVNVGAIGPLPNLYEPTWQVPGKLLSAYAEAGAVLMSTLGLGMSSRCATETA
jgi:hypothetical protein